MPNDLEIAPVTQTLSVLQNEKPIAAAAQWTALQLDPEISASISVIILERMARAMRVAVGWSLRLARWRGASKLGKG
jgi:hypothetical protein